MRKSLAVYPTGSAGAALFLLRVTVSVQIGIGSRFVEHLWFQIIAILLMALVILGFMMRPAAILIAILSVIIGLQVNGDCEALFFLHGAAAIALSFLGAGAYSIDGRLFGRNIVSLDDRT